MSAEDFTLVREGLEYRDVADCRPDEREYRERGLAALARLEARLAELAEDRDGSQFLRGLADASSDTWRARAQAAEARVVELEGALRAYRAIFAAWEGLESITLNEEALRQWKSIADATLAAADDPFSQIQPPKTDRTQKPEMPANPVDQGAERTRTAVRGFAGLCLTSRPRRREPNRSRPPSRLR